MSLQKLIDIQNQLLEEISKNSFNTEKLNGTFSVSYGQVVFTLTKESHYNKYFLSIELEELKKLKEFLNNIEL